MDSTFTSILLFLLFTVLYYIFKPNVTLEVLDALQEGIDGPYSSLTSKKYTWLLIYISLIILSQFAVNAVLLINKCGGSIGKNIGAGALLTFIPWTFIFGSMILTLIMFPGFKSAFSNVIGYFVVSGSTTEILTKLLINSDIQPALESSDSIISPEEKSALQKSAEAVVKLCGNLSIIINQIVPDNFNSYWAILTPLMKPEHKNKGFKPEPGSETHSLKEQLLNLVVMRDNIGEALWYSYTALLLISVVQYNLTVRGCIRDPQAMAEQHQEFLDEEDAQMKKEEKQNQTVYVVQ